MQEAKWGVMIHYQASWLANENDLERITMEKWNDLIDNFDCEGLAKQLADVGAGYLIITVRHTRHFFMAPNATFDRYMGDAPSICSNRDLIVDLSRALDRYDIPLIVYLPGQFSIAPAERKAFAYDRDDPRLAEAYLRWQEVVREFSIRWGDKVAGWWIDGTYRPNTTSRHPDIPNFASKAAAMRAGNPDSIVAFNPGVFPRVMSLTPHEDYTAGEITGPGNIRWMYNKDGIIDGAQIHILSYLGRTWGRGEPRFTSEEVIRHSKNINAVQGAITWDVQAHPSGLIKEPFLEQLSLLGKALK